MPDILEFSKGFGKEDQQQIWDVITNQLVNGKKEDIILRKSASISLDWTEEEMLRHVAGVLGVSVESAKRSGVWSNLQEFIASSHKVKQLTAAYREYLKKSNATADKYDELRDLGQFLIALDSGYELVIPTSIHVYPDFILSKDNKRIGVEHTRLIEKSIKEHIQYVRILLKAAENEVLTARPSLTGIFSMLIDFNAPVIGRRTFGRSKFKRHETEQIAKQIAAYVKSVVSGVAIETPVFIKSTNYTQGKSPIHFDLAEQYIGRTNFTPILEATLKPKEQKHSKYGSVENFDELWLLVTVKSTTGASSFVVDTESLPDQQKSKFDKLYLLDLVSNQIRCLK